MYVVQVVGTTSIPWHLWDWRIEMSCCMYTERPLLSSPSASLVSAIVAQTQAPESPIPPTPTPLDPSRLPLRCYLCKYLYIPSHISRPGPSVPSLLSSSQTSHPPRRLWLVQHHRRQRSPLLLLNRSIIYLPAMIKIEPFCGNQIATHFGARAHIHEPPRHPADRRFPVGHHGRC